MAHATLRIVQCGDIHHGKKFDTSKAIDDGDSSLSANFKQTMYADKLQDCLRELSQLVGKEPCDAMLFMGDIVDKGKKELYQDFLKQTLSAFVAIEGMPAKMLVLPGNHDIKREDALLPQGMVLKFKHIVDAVSELKIQPIANDLVTAIDLPNFDKACAILGINSCIGCGETRSMPDKLRTQVSDLITAQLKKASDEIKRAGGIVPDPAKQTEYDDLLKSYYETLDTPSCSDAALDDIRIKIHELADSSIAILAAHHNLLPQSLPRVAPYSELVNGGKIRGLLLSFDRPILYLHGHTHTDPIEIVRQADKPNSLLITISAPELRQGFNVIEVLFSNNRPFVLKVRKFRNDPASGKPTEIKKDELRIVLISGLEPLMTDLHSKIVKTVYGAKEAIYWPDFVAALKTNFGLSPTTNDLREAVVELSWSKHLVIPNEQEQFTNWRIQAPI
jgi:3',5'-cyclic AMP phosphodiesterase CpdA